MGNRAFLGGKLGNNTIINFDYNFPKDTNVCYEVFTI